MRSLIVLEQDIIQQNLYPDRNHLVFFSEIITQHQFELKLANQLETLVLID